MAHIGKIVILLAPGVAGVIEKNPFQTQILGQREKIFKVKIGHLLTANKIIPVPGSYLTPFETAQGPNSAKIKLLPQGHTVIGSFDNVAELTMDREDGIPEEREEMAMLGDRLEKMIGSAQTGI